MIRARIHFYRFIRKQILCIIRYHYLALARDVSTPGDVLLDLLDCDNPPEVTLAPPAEPDDIGVGVDRRTIEVTCFGISQGAPPWDEDIDPKLVLLISSVLTTGIFKFITFLPDNCTPVTVLPAEAPADEVDEAAKSELTLTAVCLTTDEAPVILVEFDTAARDMDGGGVAPR